MKKIFELYGDTILTCIIIIAIIAIALVIFVANKDTVAGWFMKLYEDGITKMNAQIP